MPSKDPCKPFACRIQKCLVENKFQESACASAIEDMRNCCRKFKNVSLTCEGIDIGGPSEPNGKPSKEADRH